MTILRFPGPSEREETGKIDDSDLAVAEKASEFMGRTLDRLSEVAGDIQQEVKGFSQSELDHVYGVLTEVIGSAASSIEDSLLYEIVTEEVERRCVLSGIDTPWADTDENGSPIADNDD